MTLRSKSLNKSNGIVVFPMNVPVPDNSLFTQIVSGADAEGMNFLDDPTMQVKVLRVPKLGLQIVWEGRRLRVEDERGREPSDSPIARYLSSALKTLFPDSAQQIQGIGFNVEVYYQYAGVIRMEDLFRNVTGGAFSNGESVLDFGWQWTVAQKDGKQTDGYFLKITAPLEVSIHHNAHFVLSRAPSEVELDIQFASMYGATHSVAERLNVN